MIGDGKVVEIVVEPLLVEDITMLYVAAGVFAFLALVAAICYRRYQLRVAAQLAKVNLEMVDQHERFDLQKKTLEAEKEELEEEVRLKKHSEEELKVMVAALESVSKERQDELKEVMMESKELKIDKLLGKGGFGVLLTVNEENVLRFRHECFLTKTLSHPNVVKLVGVCWSEDLFACCLEFVENGSLEFWLRLTAGGKKFVASKKQQKKKGPSLSEVTFQGFDHNGEYNTAEHTDVDRAKKAEAEGLLHDWWMQRMNPKMNWIEMLKEDKSRLDHGMSGYHVHDKESNRGKAMAHCYVNATPAQVAGDWTLKLTDFGEARAQNMGGTMTSVGTPIYIAPEVMRADHYDVKADTWSYGLCLVAMIRAERTLEQFFYQALRKHKKRKNTKGLGLGQMTKYYYHEGWRPILPLSFVKAYPKLHALIQECWRVRRKERPSFDQIVARLQGDIGDEIKRKEEPKIELYSVEDDLIYRNRIGKEDEIEDSDEEEGGDKSTRRGDVVSKSKHDKAMAAKDKAMQELKERKNKEMDAVKKRADAVKKRADAVKKRAEAEKKRAEDALQEKTAKEQLWGAALRELEHTLISCKKGEEGEGGGVATEGESKVEVAAEVSKEAAPPKAKQAKAKGGGGGKKKKDKPSKIAGINQGRLSAYGM
ncbi:hypothetical protein TeGR_g8563 [Tetraparma gracilis]|uniref:Protein kinase domain-containing protein n=1 Tax=Tetraparma gracilis TaxID=2962635 RepID=A0ABQ6NBM8_9STRA|nr:hypothetical protein TeGR_g8563 [Tetraparma gracilis]